MRGRPSLIIDCDPGHDDALALVLADAYANVLGITSVSGNAPPVSYTHLTLPTILLV